MAYHYCTNQTLREQSTKETPVLHNQAHDKTRIIDLGNIHLNNRSHVALNSLFGSQNTISEPLNTQITIMSQALAGLLVLSKKKIRRNHAKRICTKFMPLLKRCSIKKKLILPKKNCHRRIKLYASYSAKKRASAKKFWKKYTKFKRLTRTNNKTRQ